MMRLHVTRKTILLLAGGAASVLMFPALASAEEAAAESDARADPLFQELFTEGEALFPDNCGVCHGPEGAGNIGVPLRENTQYTKYVVRAIVNGKGNMPPVAAEFDSRTIAAILTYVSNSWGNDYGIVTEADVDDALKE